MQINEINGRKINRQMEGKKLIFMGRDMRNETIYDLDPRKKRSRKAVYQF